ECIDEAKYQLSALIAWRLRHEQRASAGVEECACQTGKGFCARLVACLTAMAPNDAAIRASQKSETMRPGSASCSIGTLPLHPDTVATYTLGMSLNVDVRASLNVATLNANSHLVLEVGNVTTKPYTSQY